METKTFEQMKTSFREASTETKIEMYVNAQDLTQPQYKELLRMFPMSALDRLEKALE